jgi:menaquinone-dependent protoporphyrinogen oxidase
MSRILVVYGSTYGQTERVVHRIAGILREGGHVVDVYKGDQLPDAFSLTGYGGVLVAASVLMGHHQQYIRKFVRRNAERFNRGPSAFVSVCGAAADDSPRAQAYVDDLLWETGWRPQISRSFTGAVAYTKYNRLFRWWLKMISRRKGLPTDTSRDWDFTDWVEVERFARELAVTLAAVPGPLPRAAHAAGALGNSYELRT